METRQLEHEGFEHTDRFEVPQREEWYQIDVGSGVMQAHFDNPQFGSGHGGKRWILRKKRAVITCSYCGQVIPNGIDTGHVCRPPQKCFEGLEHTGEFRQPRKGEPFQNLSGNVEDSSGMVLLGDGRRWILRDKWRPGQKLFQGFEHTGEYRNVKRGEWYQSHGVNGNCIHPEPLQYVSSSPGRRWILRPLPTDPDTQYQQIEKDLARAQFHVGHAVEDLNVVRAELKKLKEKA